VFRPTVTPAPFRLKPIGVMHHMFIQIANYFFHGPKIFFFTCQFESMNQAAEHHTRMPLCKHMIRAAIWTGCWNIPPSALQCSSHQGDLACIVHGLVTGQTQHQHNRFKINIFIIAWTHLARGKPTAAGRPSRLTCHLDLGHIKPISIPGLSQHIGPTGPDVQFEQYAHPIKQPVGRFQVAHILRPSVKLRLDKPIIGGITSQPLPRGDCTGHHPFRTETGQDTRNRCQLLAWPVTVFRRMFQSFSWRMIQSKGPLQGSGTHVSTKPDLHRSNRTVFMPEEYRFDLRRNLLPLLVEYPSARLTYTGYAAPDRLPKSAAPLNGYRLKEMPDSSPPGERLRHLAAPPKNVRRQ